MPTSDFTPDVDLVARKIMSRTRDQYGNHVGTFTEATHPTDLEVTNIIDDYMTDLAIMIGEDIPDDLFDDAANVASIGAAMFVELNFFPDQIDTGRSTYPTLKELYDMKLTDLISAVSRAIANDGEITPSGSSTRPNYSFPPAGIGFNTVM